MQKEIIENQDLLDNLGNIANPGYAKSLLWNYDRNAIKAKKWRIKEWDYYLIYNQKYAVALTIDDNSYMGMLSVSLIDFENKTETTKSPIKAFTKGRTNLPKSSKEGDLITSYGGFDLKFLNDGKTRKLIVKAEKFKDDKTFECEFELFDEPRDSMVIATPFEKPKHFYYNQKIVGFTVKGFAKLSDELIEFNPDDSMAILDWGRGVWTYKNTWYWGSACGYHEGKKVGFNIGYGFGDTSNATENMVFYDGIAHKLDEVTFNIPQKDNKDDFLSDWTFTSNDGRFEMNFKPILDRSSLTSVILIESDQHQVFGRFSGKIVLDDNTTLEIKDLLGFAEKVKNKW